MTMPPEDLTDLRKELRDFNFAEAMILLGWSRPASKTTRSLEVNGETFSVRDLATLGGARILEVTGGADPTTLPDEATRKKVSDKALDIAREHVLVFMNADRTQSHWFWVKRELIDGKAKAQSRTHTYVRGQPDDLFISKLAGLFVDIGELDTSGNIAVTTVAQRLSQALDSEAVVKRFYNEFKDRRESFAEQIQGIDDERERAWYASVMLNRLMFVYFLQRKGFLSSPGLNEEQRRDYLATHLKLSQGRGKDMYYPEFLKALFFEAFAKPEADRDPNARSLTGQIPYLNGGLFLPHPIEERWPAIFIPDKAFDGILDLFGRYDWNLSDLDKHAGGLDPDVLGHIFEKYINQKGFGAYYTRPEITEYLCEQTVRRLVLEKINARKPAGTKPDTNLSDALTRADVNLTRQLLLTDLPSLSLLDPACGSGAFLVAALKTLLDVYTTLVGRIHSFNDQTLNDWLREKQGTHPNANYNLKKKIITENLYGVDLMPEAAEIAKLRLFLSLVSSAQTLDDLEPLPNIDFNLLTGNSLVGLLDVNEKAYNSSGSGKGQAVLLGVGAVSYSDIVKERQRKLGEYRNAAALGIKSLTRLRDEIQADKEKAYLTLNTLLHKTFHGLKIKYEQATWDAAKGKEGKPVKRDLTLKDIEALKPFHWAFEFAEVMGRGGFDAIIANPPWDAVKPNAKEFFETHSQLVSKKKMSIKDFEKEQGKLLADPVIRAEWLAYQSYFPHISSYYRAAPQFTQQSSTVNGKKTGSDLNLYKLFLEQCFRLLRLGGECGIVTPSGIYTDLGSKGLREMLFGQAKVTSLFGLSNEKFLFEEVHHSFKFTILTFEKGLCSTTFPAAFRINPREAISKDKLNDFLYNANQHIEISIELMRRLSPDSFSLMEFKGDLDIEIAEHMLKFPLLGEKLPDSWNVNFSRGFDMTNDSYLFKTSPSSTRLPLYEGKMIHQYQQNWGNPKYWIEENEGRRALLGKTSDGGQKLSYESFRLSIRGLARGTDSRTAIATIVSPYNFENYKLTNTNTNDDRYELFLLAMINSFSFDWMLRQKVNTDVTYIILSQIPVPRLTSADPEFLPIIQAAAKLVCTTSEFDELAVSAGLRGSIDGVIDEAARAALRAELDGRVAHLYGLSESEFTHILDTFPLVARPVKDAALQAYRDLTPPAGNRELLQLSQSRESATLEFKSSLRVPTNGDPATKENFATLEAVIVKEVAAFLNSKGGTLLIGLADNGTPLGLQPDYASSPKIANRDGFELHLRSLLSRDLGATVAASIEVSFGQLGGHDLCRVQVPAGNQEAYVQLTDKNSGQKHHALYIRSGNKAEEVPSGPELSKYTRGRWPTG
jgi:Putative DNA-binding domain